MMGSRIRSLQRRSFNVKMLPSSDKILIKLQQLISSAAGRPAVASSFSVVFKGQLAEFLCSFKSQPGGRCKVVKNEVRLKTLQT